MRKIDEAKAVSDVTGRAFDASAGVTPMEL
jgi:hypothetical protein